MSKNIVTAIANSCFGGGLKTHDGNIISIERSELMEILGSLRNGISVAIVGPLGSGKTFLVHRVLERLRDEGYPTIYVSLEDAEGRKIDVAALQRTLANSLVGLILDSNSWERWNCNINSLKRLMLKIKRFQSRIADMLAKPIASSAIPVIGEVGSELSGVPVPIETILKAAVGNPLSRAISILKIVKEACNRFKLIIAIDGLTLPLDEAAKYNLR